MATFNWDALKSTVEGAASKNNKISEVSAARAEEAARDFIRILDGAAKGSGVNADFGWAYGAPRTSQLSVSIDVYAADNTRPSLDQYDYPYGVIDLVSLFNKGYSTSGYVYGTWHGNEIRSRTYFAGTHFLESAVATFNKSNEYATATLC